MTSADFARVRRLVEAAIGLSPVERAALLQRECGADMRLRAEVEDLLRASAESDQLLERALELPSVDQLAPRPGPSFAAGMRLGGFRIVRRLASGGMGTVWEAEQESPRRRVALKTLRFGLRSRESVRRFRYEAEILARLRHPHIAQVLASGVDLIDGESAPWCALEYVPGARSITDFATELALPLDARLALFTTLCEAVQHGHERGVIHRDLKPSNVLVDESGTLKVIDFGVARMADPNTAVTTMHTELGRVIGTLQYMAPEQLFGAGYEVDTRSDVYSLGAIMYELVTGLRPYDLGSASLGEAARVLSERVPQRPSERAPGVPRDLDAVVLKALSKERGERYGSAEALAADVRRFRRGEPIEARPPSLGRQLVLLARRNRAFVWALAAVLATLVVATFVSLRYAWRAGGAERAALNSARTALEERDRARFLEYTANIAAAHGALRAEDVLTAAQQLASAPEELRGFEWWLLLRRTDRSRWTHVVEGVDVAALAWLPDGERIVSATHNGAFELLDARDGRRLARSEARAERMWNCSLDPGGARLAAIFSDGQVRMLSIPPLAETGAWQAHERNGVGVAFSRDGRWLATADSGGAVRVWDAHSGALARELERAGESAPTLAWSPDGRRLAGGTSGRNLVLVWDVGSGRLLQSLAGHRGYVSDLAFARGGSVLASASHDHDIRLWNVESGESEGVWRDHEDIVWSIDIDSSGERLVSASWDRTVRLWNVAEGRVLATLAGHVDDVLWCALSPDGTRVVSADEGSRVKLWDVASGARDVVQVRGKWGWTLRAWPDSASVLAVHGGVADRWASGSDRQLARYESEGQRWNAGAPAPDGRTVALGSLSGVVALFDADNAAQRASFATGVAEVSALEWTVDGQRIAVGTKQGHLAVFDVLGSRVLELEGSTTSLDGLALRPGGGELASAGPRGELRLHDLATGRTLHTSEPCHARVSQLAWSRDGRLAALALDAGRIALWDAEQRCFAGSLLGHGATVESVSFSPDGRRLASGGNDRTARLWDVASGREVAVLADATHFVDAVEFSADGSWLATGSSDSALRWYSAGDAAWRRVETLRQRLFLGRRVRAALEADSALEPGERERSLRASEALLDDPLELARDAWNLARAAGRSPADLRMALAKAQTACEELPEERLPRLALAVARVRLGEADQALATLGELSALDPSDARAFALRALALARSGRSAEAQAELDALDSLTSPVHYPELRALADEARGVLRALR